MAESCPRTTLIGRCCMNPDKFTRTPTWTRPSSGRGQNCDELRALRAAARSVRPRSGLLQEPYLHAPEGRRESYSLSSCGGSKLIKAKRELGMFFFINCALARILPSCATRRRRILFSSARSLAISLRPR